MLKMYSLSKKAQAVKKKLAIFDSQPSDYEAVMKSLPSVVSLIEEMESMAVTCRKIIAAYQKELPLYTGLSDKKKQKISLSNIDKNVTVRVQDNVVIITLFPLIKCVSAKTKEYISYLIGQEIKTYISTHSTPDFSNSDCVVVINSLYAKPEWIRDNDSVETAAIINVLKTYFLTDDDGLHLSIFRIGSLSKRYLTEISLMKQEDFLLWFEKNRHTKME